MGGLASKSGRARDLLLDARPAGEHGPARPENPENLDHIDGQIVDRDYKLIAQSQTVVVYYPTTTLSAGVICEMKEAIHMGKRVYALWLPEQPPSPFFTRYCTRWFREEEALFDYLAEAGIAPPQGGSGSDRAGAQGRRGTGQRAAPPGSEAPEPPQARTSATAPSARAAERTAGASRRCGRPGWPAPAPRWASEGPVAAGRAGPTCASSRTAATARSWVLTTAPPLVFSSVSTLAAIFFRAFPETSAPAAARATCSQLRAKSRRPPWASSTIRPGARAVS